MRYVAIFLLMSLLSCGPDKTQLEQSRLMNEYHQEQLKIVTVPMKPFYVYDKWTFRHNDHIVMAGYGLIDRNGYRFQINDSVEKYSPLAIP
ncbi:MAG TPA: hypothetical protein VK589_29950 [Chryseolinea sp.]|nr:hypothetical protein [Chryseolinea sp.]